jgi:hypothetical protein
MYYLITEQGGGMWLNIELGAFDVAIEI